MGRVGDGRRRAEEVQSNDSGSLINFIRSNFSSRVIHHGRGRGHLTTLPFLPFFP